MNANVQHKFPKNDILRNDSENAVKTIISTFIFSEILKQEEKLVNICPNFLSTLPQNTRKKLTIIIIIEKLLSIII